MIKLILSILITICMICVFEGICTICEKLGIKATTTKLLRLIKRENKMIDGLSTT